MSAETSAAPGDLTRAQGLRPGHRFCPGHVTQAEHQIGQNLIEQVDALHFGDMQRIVKGDVARLQQGFHRIFHLGQNAAATGKLRLDAQQKKGGRDRAAGFQKAHSAPTTRSMLAFIVAVVKGLRMRLFRPSSCPMRNNSVVG